MPADFLINLAQDLARAARQQLFRQLNAHPFGLGGRAAAFAAHHLAAVRRADQGAQPQAVAIQFGIAADRHLAAAFQAGVHRPLGAHAGFGGRMVQRRQQRAVTLSSRRHSMPTAPWPTAGRHSSALSGLRMRFSSPRRFRPATARIIAS